MVSVDDIREAIVHVCSGNNAASRAAGYSPEQWVYGTSPDGGNAADVWHVGQQSDDAFSKHLECRATGVAAWTKADASHRVRRALLRRARPVRREYPVGDWVYFWRNQGFGRLDKVRYRGPAQVVSAEPSENGMPSKYWCVFGTSLFRCLILW